MYNKSPLNYIGGKYKMLPQLLHFFPKKIDLQVVVMYVPTLTLIEYLLMT